TRDERVRATDASLRPVRDTGVRLSAALDLVESAVAPVSEPTAPGQIVASDAEDLAALARRAGELRDQLRRLLRADDPAYVYFVELRGRGVFLRAAPIDVSGVVRDMLLDRMQGVVLTSATLTVDGAFDYIKSRLGTRSAAEVQLASEFDF